MGGSRKFQFLSSCGVVFVLAQPAWADFVGIVTTTEDDPDTVALCNNAEGNTVPSPLTVCNIFATFDTPSDRLLGIENADLQVYAGKTPSVFSQHPFGVDTPYGCSLLPVFPDLICDSYVTIGTKCDDPGDPEGSGNTALDPNFNLPPGGFNSNGHITGGWFDNSPQNGGDCSCLPVLAHRFLQASVAQGNTLSGTVNIRWTNTSTGEITVEQGVFVECTFGCDADLDGNGAVGASDLGQLLGAWGPCSGCPADLNSDNVVNAADLAMLLGSWGSCG